MPYELINKEHLLDVNDCPFLYREEESEAEGNCRKSDEYMYRSKVFPSHFGYYGEQRGRFWVERHVPISSESHVPFNAEKPSRFYAEKHIYDSELSQSGAYLKALPLMMIPPKQEGGRIGGDANKISDDQIRQLDFERQRAMNEFKAKRDAEHKAWFEQEQRRANQISHISDELNRAEAQALEIARKKGLRIKVF